MLKLQPTTQYKKDRKKIKKRGLPLEELDSVLHTLCQETPLESKYRDHELAGRYAGFRECHIQPDWLLIYAKNKKDLILVAVRTGTHSDLF
jgi:mRNA interferase YafQ